MKRETVAAIQLLTLAVLAASCSSPAALVPSPTAPASGGGSNGVTLNATAPGQVSPVNDQQLTAAPVLTVTASTPSFGGSVAFQYRFQVFDTSNTLVQDSGLVSTSTFVVTATLSVGARYTWRARAEYQGAVGPWSTTGSFLAAKTLSTAGAIAAQEGVTLWPGVQPPGTNGQAVLGDNWNVQTVVAFPSGVVHVTPTIDELRVFDLLDRGLDPQGAIDWINTHGYFTNAAWYPGPQVVGFDFEYMALIRGVWSLVNKLE